MRNKKSKKGFTLVELLVVIAILAVLATVSVVGYMSFTKKAQISNDESLVAQLNIALKADEAVEGKPATPSAMLERMEEEGFNVEKLTPTTSKYNIVWNQEKNEFALLDENDKLVYGNVETDSYKTWKFLNEYVENTTYSVYLKGTTATEAIEVKAGFDAGKNTGISSVTYTGDTNAKDVTIRTNGGELSIKGAQDTVRHYGASDFVDIIAVDDESYHENGVAAYARIAQGHFVAEKDAKIINLNVAGSDVTITTEDTANVGEYSKSAADIKVTVNGSEDTTAEVIADIKEEAKNSAVVAEGGIAEVNGMQFKDLQAAFDNAKDGAIVKLQKDYETLAEIIIKKNLIFDLNGYSVYNEAVSLDGNPGVSMLSIESGATVTLRDSSSTKTGMLSVLKDDAYCINIKDNSNLTIESGTYIGNVSTVQIAEGTLVIKGGTFDLKQIWPSVGNGYEYEINCIDSAYKSGKAIVSIEGGVFVGFDPSNNLAEGKGTSFLADGYTVESNPHGTNPNISIFTVVKK